MMAKTKISKMNHGSNNITSKTTSKTRNSIKIMSWNIQSRNTSYEGSKFLDPEFCAKFNPCDIVCFQETKGLIKTENYRVYNSNREGGTRAGGGVAIAVSHAINRGVTPIRTKLTPDAIAIKLSRHFFHLPRDLYIVTIYISPSNSLYRKRQLIDPWDSINEFLASIRDKGEIIICGDTNAHTSGIIDYTLDCSTNYLGIPSDFSNINYAEYELPRNNCDTRKCTNRKELMDLCTNNDLQILNGRTLGDIFGKKTYFGKLGSSCVDYFLSSDKVREYTSYLQVGKFTKFSDHCPLVLNMNLVEHYAINSSSYKFKSFPQKYKWKAENSAELFAESVNKPEIQTSFDKIIVGENFENPMDMNIRFTEILIRVADDSLGKAKPYQNTSRHKWFNNECRQGKRSLNKATRRFANKTDSKLFRDEFYLEKAKYRKTLRKHKQSYLQNLNKRIEDGKILSWQNFKQLKQEHKEDTVLDNHDLANFYEYFKNLYSSTGNDAQTSQINLSQQPIDTTSNNRNDGLSEVTLNAEITQEETMYVLKNLKNGKSVGEDLISNEMLKMLATNDKALIALVKLFNVCLESGIYPWHNSVITPPFKSGDQYDPDNYRAIAVNSCLGKTFSTILLKRLISFRAEQCDDPITQLGFRKGAQTNDDIFTLKTIIDKYRKRKKKKFIRVL